MWAWNTLQPSRWDRSQVSFPEVICLCANFEWSPSNQTQCIYHLVMHLAHPCLLQALKKYWSPLKSDALCHTTRGIPNQRNSRRLQHWSLRTVRQSTRCPIIYANLFCTVQSVSKVLSISSLARWWTVIIVISSRMRRRCFFRWIFTRFKDQEKEQWSRLIHDNVIFICYHHHHYIREATEL